MAICERIFINLLILYYGILRSKRLLMVGVCVCVCVEPLMHVVMIIDRRTSHPCCASNGCSIVHLLSLWVVASSRNLPLQYVDS